MNISVNPLKKSQREYLNSGKGVINKTQARKDINYQFEKSIRLIHHVLENTKHLKENEVYENFNAITLNKILENSLKKIGHYSDQKDFVYDFRTMELARIMFEISSKFISSSSIFSEDKFLKEGLEKISNSFITLSKSELQKHAYEKITKKQEQLIKATIRTVELDIQKIISQRKRLTKIQDEIISLKNEGLKLIIKINDAKKQKEEFDKIPSYLLTESRHINNLPLYQHSFTQVKIKLMSLNAKLSTHPKLEKLYEKKKDNEKKLLRYDDLQDYFSPINPLEESNQE